MVLTPSMMPELGIPAPTFKLPDTDDRVVTLGDFKTSPALLVAFWCNHCPYVQHIRDQFAVFVREYHRRVLASSRSMPTTRRHTLMTAPNA